MSTSSPSARSPIRQRRSISACELRRISISNDASPPFDLKRVEAQIVSTDFAGCVLHLPCVDSTNAMALAAAQTGVRRGVWVADEQTAGRGRGGHQWYSTAGDGLYVSALIAPELPITRALWLSLATGLAAQRAILEATGLRVDIRWPNDLLVNGRKCGGILVETAVALSPGDATAMLRYAVIGVGINLNHTAFPPELQSVATSLQIEGAKVVSREAVLGRLLMALDEEIFRLVREFGGFEEDASLLERFADASSWVRGKRVTVDEDGGYTGVTDGLDQQGFLRVASDDGLVRTVLSGGVRECEQT